MGPSEWGPVHVGQSMLASARGHSSPHPRPLSISEVALVTAFGTRIVGGMSAQALSERLLQGDGPAVLLEKIAERLIGQLLQRLHAVARQQPQRMPGLGVEFDELADLGRAPVGVGSMFRVLGHASTSRR